MMTDDVMVDAVVDVAANAAIDVIDAKTGMDMIDTSEMGTSMGEDYMSYDGMEPQSAGISTHTILYIVIGVCAVVGIVLGIIFGKRAANK